MWQMVISHNRSTVITLEPCVNPGLAIREGDLQTAADGAFQQIVDPFPIIALCAVKHLVADDLANDFTDKRLNSQPVLMRVVMLAAIMHERLAGQMAETRQAFRIMEQVLIVIGAAIEIVLAV